MHNVTLACATWNNRLVDAWQFYQRSQPLLQGVRFLIVHQLGDSSAQAAECFKHTQVVEKIQSASALGENVEYLPLNNRGISKSRNAAISHCRTRYIWFFDDDLTVLDDAHNSVMSALERSADIYLFETQTPNGVKRAIYPRDRATPSSRNLLRVASFEILADVEFLRQHSIYFDERMGLGSDEGMPMGEEAVFLSLARRAGAQIHHVALVLATHPEVSTGKLVNEPNFYAKGGALARSFDTREKVKFYLKDVYRLLKNRHREFGDLKTRMRLIIALTKGCLVE